MCPIKIFPIETVRKLDAYTIAYEPIKSIDLMERAAVQCTEWIMSSVPPGSTIKIICGMGNNGGDGLAIARLLHSEGFYIEVFYIRHSARPSDDNAINFGKIADIAGIIVTEIFEEDPLIELEDADLVIDALLGSGLNKPVVGFPAEIIRQVNRFQGIILSIDIPSGLFADKPMTDGNRHSIITADYTLTFQMPKLAFFMPENDKFVGNWQILDIGLHDDFIHSAETDFFYTIIEDCEQIYKPRKRFSHKGTYGHSLLIAGSLGKIGAAILSAKACLRAGAGLVTAHIPLCGMDAMHAALPEVMIDIDESDTHFSYLPQLDVYDAIGVGPGIGMHEETQRNLKLLIQETNKPLILDADALNIIAENKTWLSFLPPDTILTPHPKEFERLTNKVDNHFNRIEILKAFAVRYKINVVLKGAYTAVGLADGTVFFNSTGNPGMATAGSGDVLTGILLGLRSAGYSARDTCILGTWLHGMAGDLAAAKISQPSIIASDIIKYLGKAFLKLQ